jgi:hypothetical protein
MYSSNSAQLIQNILSNPTLANEYVDYVQNIKPKLSQLLSKIPILKELENRLDNKQEEKKDLPEKESKDLSEKESSELLDKADNEYKELLIKLKLKYDNLRKEYKTIKTENTNLQTENTNLQTENTNLQTKESIDNYKECKECDKKNDIIKQFTSHINKPCSLCEEKDRQIHKLFQKNDKICKEKDDQINELKSKCIILQKQAINSANELARLQSLNMISSDKLEKIDIISSEQNKSKNVFNELSKQFGDFIQINKSN